MSNRMDSKLRDEIVKTLAVQGVTDGYICDKTKAIADSILSLLAPVFEKAEKWDRIGTHVYGLAMLVLQSPFYRDLDVKEVVDIILGETMPDILKEAP